MDSWQRAVLAEHRVRDLTTAVRRTAERLRYLAASVPASELDNELHALARQCEDYLGNEDPVLTQGGVEPARDIGEAR